VEDYLKVFTLLSQEEIEEVMAQHRQSPGARAAQVKLAVEVTKLIHGEEQLAIAHEVTDYLKGASVAHATDSALEALRKEVACTTLREQGSVIYALVS